MYRIKIFFENIIRVIQYVPAIWTNGDFGIYHIITMLEFKLKRLRNNLEEYYIDGNNSKIEVRKQIDKTLDAINKYNNEFELFPMIEPEELYNVEMFWKKTLHKDRNTHTMGYMFEDGKEVPENHEFFEYQSKYFMRQYKWQQACWNRIFNTIRDCGQYWWD